MKVDVEGGDGAVFCAAGARVAISFTVDILRSVLQWKSLGRIVEITRPDQCSLRVVGSNTLIS